MKRRDPHRLLRAHVYIIYNAKCKHICQSTLLTRGGTFSRNNPNFKGDADQRRKEPTGATDRVYTV